MKLIFLIDNGRTIGGGDYSQFKFAEHLAKLGNEVLVYAGNRNEFLKDFSEIPRLKIKFRGELPRTLNGIGKIKGMGRINDLWNIIHTNFVIKPYLNKNSKNVDFIIGYLRGPAIKAKKLGKKYSIKTVNFIFENPNWMKKKIGKRFFDQYQGRFKKSWEQTKIAYLNTDILIPNSELTRKECSAWLNKKVEEPVYPGINPIEDRKKTKEENQIIYVGRLNEYKNVNEIIKALSKIKNPPKLVIVGKGEEETKLKNIVKKLNVLCEFKGSLTDEEKWNEIRKSMFMVFPSSFEGFGMPPAEALACRKPCICSDIPIFREVYGNKVEYFKEHDINGLVKKIKFLIKNPNYRKRRGKEGRNYVLKKYTWKKSAKKIEKILNNYKK